MSTATATRDSVADSTARPRNYDITTFVTLGAALILFVVALHTTNQDAMNGYGLISVLGWQFFAALVLVCYAAAREFSRRTLRPSHLAAVTIVMIIILFGIQNGSDSAAGFSTAWLHTGFASYIAENGKGVQFYDARFSWPGFFAAAASLTTLAGIHDAVPLLRWAPIAYNLLALIPLVLLARHATTRAHVAWLGILLYYCANWFEQDYFSPQATNLVLYLTTIALLFWLGHKAAPGIDVGVLRRVRRWWKDGVLLSVRRLLGAILNGRPVRVPGTTASQYVLLELGLVVVITASVISHQLTPVAMILALMAFSLSGHTRYKGLWLVAGIVFIGWFSYGATDYWFGHLENVIGDVGQGGSTLKSGVSERISGDPAHLHVQFLRLLMAGGYLALACIGLFIRRKTPWLPVLGALALGPFIILGLQSYGGEVVIRCFLFATPMLVLLAAEIVSPIFRWRRQWCAAAVMVILLAASFLQVTARGANQPFERMTSDQIAAVRLIQSRLGTGTVTAANATTSTIVDTPVDINVLDAPGETVSITKPPSHGKAVVDDSTGAIVYTPGTGWYGLDMFNYRKCDAQGAKCSTATATVVVTPSVGYFNDFNPLALMPPRSIYLASLEDCTLPDATAAAIEKAGSGTEVACAKRDLPDYIYASSSQAAYGILVEGKPTDWLDQVVTDLVATGDYVKIVDDPHVTLLKRVVGATK